VVTDTRQPNEYAALKSAGYVLIRVECPDAIRIARAQAAGDTFTHADLAHPTETALDGYAADFTVMNGAGLAELYARIDAVVAQLTIKETV
jgi:dephospho-CoA kinase